MGDSARTLVDSMTGVRPPALVQPKPSIRVVLFENLEAGRFGQAVQFLIHKAMDVAQSLASVSPIEKEICRADLVCAQSGLRPGDDSAAQPGAVQKIPHRKGKRTRRRQQSPDFTYDLQPQFVSRQVMQYRESQHPLEGAGCGRDQVGPARIGKVRSDKLKGRRSHSRDPLVQEGLAVVQPHVPAMEA